MHHYKTFEWKKKFNYGISIFDVEKRYIAIFVGCSIDSLPLNLCADELSGEPFNSETFDNIKITSFIIETLIFIIKVECPL